MTRKGNIKKYIVTQIPTDNKYEDDYVVQSIGSFGIWQALVCSLVATTRIIAAWNIITIVYLTPNTDFVCAQFRNDSSKLLDVINNTCYDDCVEYAYYNTIFETTLTSEFDLICERAWMASFIQTTLMFGLFFGVNLFGWISDRFGRRISLILSVAVPVVFSVASPFAPDYWTFSFLRFFVGLGCGGIFTVTIVIIIEIIGPKYREIGGGLGIIIDGIAQASIVLFACYAATWRLFLLYLGLVSIFILLLMIFLPETPRWLIANKRSENAVTLMTKVANFNKLKTENIKQNVEKSIQDNENKQKYPEKKNPGFLDLFKTKELAMITIFSIIIWSVTGACFFGINQYVPLLGNNVHMIVLASGLAQVPGTLLGVVFNKWSGRKISTFFSSFTSGIVMAALIFTPTGHWSTVALAIIGLMSSVTTLTIIHVQVNELFPTVLRNMGFGISSGGAELAGMVAPFMVPANLLSIVINKYFGRKISSILLAVIVGIAMGVLTFVPDGTLAASLAVIGLSSASSLLMVLAIQVNELYPTVLRCKAYGINSGGSKVSSMIAPFIVNIKPHWISSMIFSVISLIGACFCLLLPETKGKILEDSIQKKGVS